MVAGRHRRQPSGLVEGAETTMMGHLLHLRRRLHPATEEAMMMAAHLRPLLVAGKITSGIYDTRASPFRLGIGTLSLLLLGWASPALRLLEYQLQAPTVG